MPIPNMKWDSHGVFFRLSVCTTASLVFSCWRPCRIGRNKLSYLQESFSFLEQYFWSIFIFVYIKRKLIVKFCLCNINTRFLTSNLWGTEWLLFVLRRRLLCDFGTHFPPNFLTYSGLNISLSRCIKCTKLCTSHILRQQ